MHIGWETTEFHSEIVQFEWTLIQENSKVKIYWRIGFFLVAGFISSPWNEKLQGNLNGYHVASVWFCGSEGTRDCYHCADTMCTLMRYLWELIGHTFVFIFIRFIHISRWRTGREFCDLYHFINFAKKFKKLLKKIFSRVFHWMVNFIIHMIGQKQQWLSGINFKEIKPSTENYDTIRNRL